MARYPQSAVTAKRGLNHVRSTVENGGSLFIKIDQDSDLGIDALIELISDGKPLNQQIAVQIKSGQSYYSPEAEECAFPIENHGEYWLRHCLPVYGIVFVPSLETAHWIDIKEYLQAHPEATTIRFVASEANRFDSNSFTRIFVPRVAHRVPSLSLDEAIKLVHSAKLDEFYLGVVVLFRRYPNVLRTWDELVGSFRERPVHEIPSHLIYYLAHVPWHGDIGGYGEQLTSQTRSYARDLLRTLTRADIVKLLSLIDSENMISRGSIGQSVEAIISSLPDARTLLEQIAGSPDEELFVRECAALIVGMHDGPGSIPILKALESSGSWYAGEMLRVVKEYGYIDPY